MNILAIETSCDESAAAVVTDGRTVRSSVIATQFQFHNPYSGVVPELASRAHVLHLNKVIEEAVVQAGFEWNPKRPERLRRSIDALAVTTGPGLVGSLLVGKMAAEALGWAYDIPVIGVNHIEGHLLSPVLIDKKLQPPFLGLVVSGGHTELIVASDWGKYHLLGRTRDDAAGEAFDKVAKMLKLGYPGGPIIDRLAKEGSAKRSPFPRAWLPGTWDFSFSGLKTAVLYRTNGKKLTAKSVADICAGFQDSVVDVLVSKSLAAAAALKIKHLAVGGGVAANSQLRARLLQESADRGVTVHMAPPNLCTDNAAMIASAAFFMKSKRGLSSRSLAINPQIHVPFFRRKTTPFQPPRPLA